MAETGCPTCVWTKARTAALKRKPRPTCARRNAPRAELQRQPSPMRVSSVKRVGIAPRVRRGVAAGIAAPDNEATIRSASSGFEPVGETCSSRHAATNSDWSQYHRRNSSAESLRENTGRSTKSLSVLRANAGFCSGRSNDSHAQRASENARLQHASFGRRHAGAPAQPCGGDGSLSGGIAVDSPELQGTNPQRAPARWRPDATTFTTTSRVG